MKHDTLSRRVAESALAVHPRRGSPGVIEFRAKPVLWDLLLWQILHISGNEKKHVSFHFWGTFTCDTPALVQETIGDLESVDLVARKMVDLAERCMQMPHTWSGYDLVEAIRNEHPQQGYRYHMTRVVERISVGDRQAAREICEAALRGDLDLRRQFLSWDALTPPDAGGYRPSQSFFELALLWMRRN